jgi:hypothetical protein
MVNVRDLFSQAVFVTERVCAEVRNAQLTWAHFEAINGESDGVRDQLRTGVNRLALGNTLHALVMAITRDTLMALFRATDNPGDKNERLTLCRLSALLEVDELREDRKAAAGKWAGSTFPELREKDASKCESWMQAIRDAVPPKWNERAPPADRRLFDLRNALKPLRDSALAHALDGDGNVVINDIRSFLEITSELAAHAELIFREAASNWEAEKRRSLKQANLFWDHCQKGF